MRPRRHHFFIVAIAGLIFLSVGAIIAAIFVPRALRDLRSMRNAAALQQWKAASPTSRNTIQGAWRAGTAVADENDARLAVEMSQHVDRVIAATRRVVWLACATVPGVLLLVFAESSTFVWVIVAAVVVIWLALDLITVQSRRRRHRSVALTMQAHALP